MSMRLSTYTPRLRRPGAAAPRANRRSGIARAVACALVLGALVCAPRPAAAQFTQQGAKLVGTGAVGAAYEGWSVAVASAGNTAIVGGPYDNSETGAAWAFSRSGGVWTQQGPKLVGSGAVGAALQGNSVALSADGNTAIVGGPGDNSDTGAAWVFTLGGNVKLVGSGAVGAALQGNSVALSADGNTAIVGGPGDNSDAGAAWVFTQSGGVWTQQAKLVGSGAVGAAYEGWSVALSADGNTAIVGGPYDNSDTGAAWVFTQSGGVWTQQAKLVGSGAVGAAYEGVSVALSADGNTAIVGGPFDNSDTGAAWVFTQSGRVWGQLGSKLVGGGAFGRAQQGWSVALSADGYTAIVGGPNDTFSAGAAWVFTQSGRVWGQLGSKLVGSGAVGFASQGVSVALSADGYTAIVGGPYDNFHTGAAWVFVSPSLTAAPTSGQAPLAVSFRAIGLTPSITYTIAFGDGTFGAVERSNCPGVPPARQCSGLASHTYTRAGTYTATLVNASGSTPGTVTINVGG